MLTDIVGFTVLTQSYEKKALDMLEAHNQLLRPFFSKYNGREIKTIGDSFLVEFGSALDAIECAIDIQRFLHDDNSSSKDEWKKVKLRIGIHLGDVVHSGSDIFGDAVNIASRIQPLADPEGICLSEQVFDQVHNKITYPLKRLETPQLKNIAFSTNVYQVSMPWDQDTIPQDPLARDSDVDHDKHRIAVLPFTNISFDPNDEYFAEGLTEEMINVLSQIQNLRVVARTSVNRFKNTDKSILQIFQELGVGTILEGSVRKAGNRIRATLQLIDTRT